MINLRADRGPLSPPITATIYEGRVARTHAPGDALVYSTGPEHRDATELTKIADQLVGVKVYLGHPETFPAKDSEQRIVGIIESARIDEDTVVARISVTDDEALSAIQSGTYELSLGYACGLDGERYQRNIQIDHLAIVDRARCGATCSMRTDMLEPLQHENPLVPGDSVKFATIEVPVELMLTDETKQLLDAMSMMGKVKCPTCGATYPKGESHVCPKADQDLEPVKPCTCKIHAINHNTGEHMSETNTEDKSKLDAEVATLKAKVTALEVEATNARKDADAYKAQLDTVKSEADKAKTDAEAAITKVKTDAEEASKTELDTRVTARVGLLVEAGNFDLKDTEGAKLDLSKLSDRDIKCAVIKHVDGDDVPSDKSIDYVDGVYRGSLKRGSDASGSRETARVAIQEMRANADAAPRTGKSAEQTAKDAMKRASALAWTKSQDA